MPVHYISEARADHVRINLGRGYVGMAEHGLNTAKVGAALQKVRRKTVA